MEWTEREKENENENEAQTKERELGTHVPFFSLSRSLRRSLSVDLYPSPTLNTSATRLSCICLPTLVPALLLES